MEDQDVFGNHGALLPVVCRACGGVQRFSVTTLLDRGEADCASCGRTMDLALVAASLPPVVRPEAPRGVEPRLVSEFP